MTSTTQPASRLRSGMVAVAGVPFDGYSSFIKGAAAAPAQIRAALHSDATNLCTENGLDLAFQDGWLDIGDFVFPGGTDPMAVIDSAVAECLSRDARLLALGGDHSITYPIIKAYARQYPRLAILHLDAHADLYDEFQGNRTSHACPFARIMEQGLVQRLTQAGIRTLTAHHRDQAKRFDVEILEMRDWRAPTTLAFNTPLYLSIDLDALDPAFAPGVGHPEPGGFATRDVLAIIQNVRAEIVGADIVELNPSLDPSGITARVAAKFLKEILARMLPKPPK
jgi:arginase